MYAHAHTHTHVVAINSLCNTTCATRNPILPGCKLHHPPLWATGAVSCNKVHLSEIGMTGMSLKTIEFHSSCSEWIYCLHASKWAMFIGRMWLRNSCRVDGKVFEYMSPRPKEVKLWLGACHKGPVFWNMMPRWGVMHQLFEGYSSTWVCMCRYCIRDVVGSCLQEWVVSVNWIQKQVTANTWKSKRPPMLQRSTFSYQVTTSTTMI